MSSAPEFQLLVHVRGVQANDPPRKFVHARHHLSLVLKGEGPYFNGGFPFPPRPCLSFSPAGDDDVNGFVGPVEAWFVGFDWPGMTLRSRGLMELQFAFGGAGAADDRPEPGTDTRGSFATPRVKTIDAATAAQGVDLFTQLQKASQRQDAVGRIEVAGRLMQLLAYYFKQPGGGGGGSATAGHRALARFHDLLTEHACDPVTIEDLAAQAGATADHVRDLFRARYGMRPVAFRTGVRLAQARDLLGSTTLNVGAVARRVGYPDPLYFSRAFRRHFGITPSDLIHRYRLPG